MATKLHPARDRAVCEALIYTEARLLDERRYRDWLGLYTDDATYWIPSWLSATETVSDAASELSYLYLTRERLQDFVVRMESGTAHVAAPAHRTSRLIANLLMDEAAPGLVRAKWLLHTARKGVDETYSGDCEYRLVETGGGLKIAAKKVIVINDPVRTGRLPLI